MQDLKLQLGVINVRIWIDLNEKCLFCSMKLGIYCILCAHVAVVLRSCAPSIHHTRQHGLFCVRTSSSLGRTRYSFLRRGGADEGSVRLYRTVWTTDGRVEECSVSTDRGHVRDYASLCSAHSAVYLNKTSVRFNVSALLDPGGPCRLDYLGAIRSDPDRHRSGVKKRQKRAWIFPGTLWCGQGSSADEYEQLGNLVYSLWLHSFHKFRWNLSNYNYYSHYFVYMYF